MRFLLLPALLLLLLLQAAFAGEVFAHALLVESEPANGALLQQSPERVVATFSEELDSGLSSMRVFDAQGAQVDNGDGGVDLNDLDHLSMVVTLPPLPAGTYTVSWNVLSAADGDGTEGAFTFTLASGGVETAAQPAEGNTNLITGAIIIGALLLLALIVIVVWRRQTAANES